MNIHIRKYTPFDAAAIDEIYERCHKGTFGRPDLKHVVSGAVVEIDNKIVGYGAIEIIAEGMMILDTDRSNRERVAILNELIASAMFIANHKDFKRFYIFPSDSSFMNILIKHYNFEKCSPILVCELEK